MALGIEDEAADLDQGIDRIGPRATQHRFDARDEFLRSKGFGDVVVGGQFERPDFVLLLAAAQSP